jgi:hypothetical protein
VKAKFLEDIAFQTIFVHQSSAELLSKRGQKITFPNWKILPECFFFHQGRNQVKNYLET